MISVSVAMATYNGERFLDEQLESLAAQTLRPAELFAVDDGSTDRTVEILEEFAQRSTFPVRIHRNESRLGFAEAFLTAADRCRGELTAFCDQDDVWLPTKLARCAAAVDRDAEILLAMHSSRIVDELLSATGRTFPRFGADAVLDRASAHPWLAVRGMSMVYRTRLMDAAEWERRPRSHASDARLHHDEWIYALARGLGRIAVVADVLALYRQHGANVAGAPRGFQERVRNTVGVGWTYYAARRGQALEWAALFREIATRGTGSADGRRARETAADYERVAERLARRLEIYEAGVPAPRRLARAARLAGRGGYRDDHGFGLGSFARDLLMIALGRRG
jgi:glycosyltransferase involved in cell wall biosynthesis